MCETEYGRLIACMQRRGDRSGVIVFSLCVCCLCAERSRLCLEWDGDAYAGLRRFASDARGAFASEKTHHEHIVVNVDYIYCVIPAFNNGRLAQLVRAFV
jgi:hypothetical protein